MTHLSKRDALRYAICVPFSTMTQKAPSLRGLKRGVRT